MDKLTLAERNQIKAIKSHLKTVDYGSYSADAIGKLLRIIERLTHTAALRQGD